MCSRDEDVQDFLRRNAIRYEKKSRARTYLLMDADVLNVLGYFTIALHNLIIDTENVSKSLIQRYLQKRDELVQLICFL